MLTCPAQCHSSLTAANSELTVTNASSRALAELQLVHSLNQEKVSLSAGCKVELLPVRHRMICHSSGSHEAYSLPEERLRGWTLRGHTSWWIFTEAGLSTLRGDQLITKRSSARISGSGRWTAVPLGDNGSFLPYILQAAPLPSLPDPHRWLLVLIFLWFLDQDKEHGEESIVFTSTPTLISLFGMNDFFFFLLCRHE